MNKSYRKGYAFQRRVKKYLEKKGFEVIVRPRSQFPDITAYKSAEVTIEFHIDAKGNQTTMLSEPFVIFDIECKVNKYLTKKEKGAAMKRLKEKKCNGNAQF